jgi:hypothetical protein
MRLLPIGLAAAWVSLLSGCASLGPAGEKDARKLTWFSYVNGEDLRAKCSSDEPDRYRLIYNSKENAQLRTYEVRGSEPRAGGEAGADGGSGVGSGVGGALVEARIIPADALWRHDPEDTLAAGQSASMRLYLSPDQFQKLTSRLAESGVFDGSSMELHSRPGGVFWLASGCHEGSYFLTAFSNPSDRFENIGMDTYSGRAD